jgi:endonuclease-3 related protein
MMAKKRDDVLRAIYDKLWSTYGAQGWWPGSGGRDEIILSAVLVQNTSWSNVEKALKLLNEAGIFSLAEVHALSHADLATLLRPVGCFNVKARRVHSLTAWLEEVCGFDLRKLDKWDDAKLRAGFLSVSGIGEETADDIMVYAFERCSFVIDAYTRRIMERHGLTKEKATYGELQQMWEVALERSPQVYNEGHALLVHAAKNYCHKKQPNCSECPLFSEEFFQTKKAWQEIRSAGRKRF